MRLRALMGSVCKLNLCSIYRLIISMRSWERGCNNPKPSQTLDRLRSHQVCGSGGCSRCSHLVLSLSSPNPGASTAPAGATSSPPWQGCCWAPADVRDTSSVLGGSCDPWDGVWLQPPCPAEPLGWAGTASGWPWVCLQGCPESCTCEGLSALHSHAGRKVTEK